MLLFTFICSILILNVPMSQGQCVYEVDIDYFGNDLTYVFTSSVDACCNLCSFYPGCIAYTYVRDSQACWLKGSRTGSRYASPGRTSGLKVTVPVTTAAPIIATTPTTVAATTTTVATTTLAPVTTTTTTTTTTVTTPTTPSTPSTPTTPVTSSITTLLTTTAAATTTQKFGCFVENDINYIGNDLRSQYVDSMGDCCNLCGATPGCVVWAYWNTFKFCYLKNALPSLAQRQSFTNMFSGLITLR